MIPVDSSALALPVDGAGHPCFVLRPPAPPSPIQLPRHADACALTAVRALKRRDKLIVCVEAKARLAQLRLTVRVGFAILCKVIHWEIVPLERESQGPRIPLSLSKLASTTGTPGLRCLSLRIVGIPRMFEEEQVSSLLGSLHLRNGTALTCSECTFRWPRSYELPHAHLAVASCKYVMIGSCFERQGQGGC